MADACNLAWFAIVTTETFSLGARLKLTLSHGSVSSWEVVYTTKPRPIMPFFQHIILGALLKKETNYAQNYAHFRKLCSSFLKKCWSTQISHTTSNHSERTWYGERGCWSWTLPVTDFSASNWTIERVPRDRHLRSVPIVPYMTRTWQWKPKPRCSRNSLHVICHHKVKKETRRLLLHWKIPEIWHFALKMLKLCRYFQIMLVENYCAFRSQICQKLSWHNCQRPSYYHKMIGL